MSKKTYKVWVRVCIEEYDPVKDDHRNVTDHKGKLVDDVDPEEYSSLEFPHYGEAQSLAADIAMKIPKLFGGSLHDD